MSDFNTSDDSTNRVAVLDFPVEGFGSTLSENLWSAAIRRRFGTEFLAVVSMATDTYNKQAILKLLKR